MLARELFRNDPERVRTMLGDRHTEAPLDRLLEVDASWREVLVRVEELKARRNLGSKEIGGLYRDGRQDEAEELKAEMSVLGDQIKGLETNAREFEAELTELELQIPNLF
jgi:seryl-tRNA synthetase